MNDVPSQSLQIDASKTRAVLLMSIRMITVVIGAIGVLVAAIRAHNLASIVAWIKSDDFVQTCLALTFLAGIASSVIATLRKKARELYLTWHVDDKIAVAPGLTAEPPKPST